MLHIAERACLDAVASYGQAATVESSTAVGGSYEVLIHVINYVGGQREQRCDYDAERGTTRVQ